MQTSPHRNDLKSRRKSKYDSDSESLNMEELATQLKLETKRANDLQQIVNEAHTSERKVWNQVAASAARERGLQVSVCVCSACVCRPMPCRPIDLPPIDLSSYRPIELLTYRPIDLLTLGSARSS